MEWLVHPGPESMRNLESLRAPWLGLTLFLAGCGGAEGSGPPANAGGSSGSDVNDVDDAMPQPGVCQPMCCSDADCAGKACVPFDAAYGTLGVCAPGSVWPSADGAAGTGPTFDAACWKLNEPECNPFTNDACDPGDACDVGALGTNTEPSVSCFNGDAVQQRDEPCDNVLGPYCMPGLHCVPNE